MVVVPEPVRVAVKDLVLWDGNPRRGRTDLIGDSISRYGFLSTPVYRTEVVDGVERKVLYGGNHRVIAAREQGVEYVWAVCVDHLSFEEVQSFALVDNRVTDLADYDTGLLESVVETVSLEGLEGFGLDSLISDRPSLGDARGWLEEFAGITGKADSLEVFQITFSLTSLEKATVLEALDRVEAPEGWEGNKQAYKIAEVCRRFLDEC